MKKKKKLGEKINRLEKERKQLEKERNRLEKKNNELWDEIISHPNTIIDESAQRLLNEMKRNDLTIVDNLEMDFRQEAGNYIVELFVKGNG